MRGRYHTINRQGKAGERELAAFLVRNGQGLLPMRELIAQSRLAVDELIDVMGRACGEAVLGLSARPVAGAPPQGRARQGDIVGPGAQPGRVRLQGRQLQVTRPRRRRKGRGANKQVPIAAYEAMQPASIGQRMREILLQGVSTRRYQRVISEMAATVGVSKSTVRREAIEAFEAALKQGMERRNDELDLRILSIDGMPYQDQWVLAGVGVDVEGRKPVRARREGATAKAEAAKDLRRHLVEPGVDPARRRQFVIDGWKALRTAINAVFGAEAPVQRCRNHQLRNVLVRRPRPQQAQTASRMRAAGKMNPKEGMARFCQMAAWLQHDWPAAAAALLDGLEECFTINRLDVPPSWHRCLATRNIVDHPHAGVRERTRRLCRWQPGMAARWSAAALLEIDKSFRKIMGYRDLWALKAILDGLQPATGQAVA